MVNLSDYVEVQNLLSTDALPGSILTAAIEQLPEPWACFANGRRHVRRELAESHRRVVTTDFQQSCWSLANDDDVEATVHWCMVGGSFLADFAMDPSKPCIFAWGLSPVREPAYFALKQLKGRDADRVPTAVCCPVERIPAFVDRTRLEIDDEILLSFLAMGPAGVRIPANDSVPPHYLSSEGTVQFIVAGLDSLYMRLVSQYMERTHSPLMGVTSGNLSGKGKYASRNRGTHKNIDEIQTDMGNLGIPILAGVVDLPGRNDSKEYPISRKYHLLHDRYEGLPRKQFARSTDLLPLSVTVCEPKIEEGRRYFDIVRHGSLHGSVIQARLAEYGVQVRLKAPERLELAVYA